MLYIVVYVCININTYEAKVNVKEMKGLINS